MVARLLARALLVHPALLAFAAILLALAACSPVPTTPAPAPRSPAGTAAAGTPPPVGRAVTPAPSPATSGGDDPSPLTSALPAGVAGEPATVVEVIDGDTVTVQVDGRRAVVRLIGVDAPESSGPYTTPECYAAESTLRDLLARSGWQVVLERDRSEVDAYDRLLRYLWAPVGSGWVLLNGSWFVPARRSRGVTRPT